MILNLLFICIILLLPRNPSKSKKMNVDCDMNDRNRRIHICIWIIYRTITLLSGNNPRVVGNIGHIWSQSSLRHYNFLIIIQYIRSLHFLLKTLYTVTIMINLFVFSSNTTLMALETGGILFLWYFLYNYMCFSAFQDSIVYPHKTYTREKNFIT